MDLLINLKGNSFQFPKRKSVLFNNRLLLRNYDINNSNTGQVMDISDEVNYEEDEELSRVNNTEFDDCENNEQQDQSEDENVIELPEETINQNINNVDESTYRINYENEIVTTGNITNENIIKENNTQENLTKENIAIGEKQPKYLILNDFKKDEFQNDIANQIKNFINNNKDDNVVCNKIKYYFDLGEYLKYVTVINQKNMNEIQTTCFSIISVTASELVNLFNRKLKMSEKLTENVKIVLTNISYTILEKPMQKYFEHNINSTKMQIAIIIPQIVGVINQFIDEKYGLDHQKVFEFTQMREKNSRNNTNENSPMNDYVPEQPKKTDGKSEDQFEDEFNFTRKNKKNKTSVLSNNI